MIIHSTKINCSKGGRRGPFVVINSKTGHLKVKPDRVFGRGDPFFWNFPRFIIFFPCWLA